MGAGLGLYFGWFFRTVRTTTDFSVPLMLAVLITSVMVLLRYVPKSRPPVDTLLPFALKRFAIYLLVLVVLELRVAVMASSGRTAVIAMTTTMGMIVGWLYGKQADANA